MIAKAKARIRFFLTPSSFVVGVLLFAIGFFQSLAFMEQTGAVDFRNRVVAARQAALGHDPYVFKWNPSFPDTLLDPSDELQTRYTRMTSPPTTLAAHGLGAQIDWPTQKRLNFAANWLALLALGAWIAFRFRTGALGTSLILLAIGVFAVSGAWQFHAERGQQYVYFTVLLLIAALPLRGTRTQAWMRSGASALAVFFRQTLGMAVFLSVREARPFRSILRTAVIGALLMIPVLVQVPTSSWKNYLATTRDWYLRKDLEHEVITPDMSKGAFTIPATGDGDAHLAKFVAFRMPGNIVYDRYRKWTGTRPPYAAALGLTLLVTALGGLTLWRARKETDATFAIRFFSLVYLTDLLLPAPRSGYNAILFLPAVLLGLMLWTDLRRSERMIRFSMIPAFLALGVSLSGATRPEPGTGVHFEFLLALSALAALIIRPISSDPSPLERRETQ